MFEDLNKIWSNIGLRICFRTLVDAQTNSKWFLYWFFNSWLYLKRHDSLIWNKAQSLARLPCAQTFLFIARVWIITTDEKMRRLIAEESGKQMLEWFYRRQAPSEIDFRSLLHADKFLIIHRSLAGLQFLPLRHNKRMLIRILFRYLSSLNVKSPGFSPSQCSHTKI